MNKKLLWFPLLAALLSTGFLYTVGNIFEISFLNWNFYKETSPEGVTLEAEGSLVPFIIGSIVGFFTEKILKIKKTTLA
ncbi:hypothetical protein [Thalassobacillus sp. C254]|uniref:hypothetical protein n=1 Tax=Thalassobacillus sp. C254 TaxID=1225341 RepID=UPI0006D07207|nr:hypothetical protein [Thalassobacillus sp. C254]